MSQNKTGKLLIYLASGVVAGAVIWGFSLVGSPSFNRKLSADRNRIEDLGELRSSIEYYYGEQEALPKSLQNLKERPYWKQLSFEDPITKIPYDYKVTGEFNYELCATFDLSSKDGGMERSRNNDRYESSPKETVWAHEIGHQCFNFEIPKSKQKNKL